MNGITVIVLSCAAPWWLGVDADKDASQKAQVKQVVQAKKTGETPSLAEKIARLQGAIEDAKKQQADFENKLKELKEPSSEYNQALEEFQKLDEQYHELKDKLDKLRKGGKKDALAEMQAKYKTLQDKRRIAQERFNLAIQERKMMQQKVNTLPERIRQDQQALDELLGKAPPPDEKKGKAAADDKKTAANPADADGGKTDAKPNPPPIQKTATTPAVPSLLPAKGPTAKTEPPPANAAPALLPKPSENKALKKAKQDAEIKQDAARKAKDRAEAVTKRLETLDKDIELDQSLLQTAQKKVEFLQKELQQLEQEQRRLPVVGGKQDQVDQLQEKADEVKDRLDQAQQEVRSINENLVKLRAEKAELCQEQQGAMQEAARKKLEAEKAQEKVAELQNPFTIRNVVQWSLDHGPPLLTILVVMLVLRFLARTFSRQIVRIITKSGQRFHVREAENRAQTLAGIFTNIASLLIVGGGTLMILDTIGLPIVPLMGGAAVFGLAVAFGTQNLIRDYFTGFMVLLEDQYGINDVVKIGAICGQVERITLRMTVVRDLEGIVHFVPHGTITTVSNMTHGWSQALFEIGVAYAEDADRVMHVLEELCRELRQDPDFGPLILQDADMLGVDHFADSAVMIKFTLKTRPLKQWRVKRELLRRIKKRFDEQGIEIPFPHRTVYHRTEAHAHQATEIEAQRDQHAA